MSMGSRAFRASVGLALALAVSGCYTMTHDASWLPDDSASLSRQSDANVIRTFRTERRGLWLAGGALPLMTPNLGEALQSQVGGHAVQGVRIRSELTLVDGALTVASSIVLAILVNTLLPPGRLGATDPAAASNMSLLNTLMAAALTPHFRTIVVEGEVTERPQGKRP